MNFLKKVILVNSWPNGNGKFRVFEVDGGAILQGGNGVGKTSTLILPLLFYGARPSDVMRASKKKSDKFVNRYLPTDSSYIAFEYVKNNQSKLVIVHSPDGENLYYLFCDSGFSDKLFLDEHNRFIKVDNLRNHLQVNNGVAVYKKRFGVMQYREIIQSAKRLPLNQNDARTINEAKQRFSLCENNESIAGSEKVAVSIISSSPSFQSIKDLIAQEVEIFDGGVQDQLSKETNVKELQQQATIIRQTKGFLTHQDKVKDLSVLSRTISELEGELGQLKYQALTRQEEQESLKTTTDTELTKRNSSFSAYEAEYNEQNREHNKVISQLNGDVSDAHSRVTRLQNDFQAYQNSGIEDKRRQGELVSELTIEVELLKKQLDSLKGAFDKIDRLYQEQIDALEKSFNERISAEKERLSSEKDREETVRQSIQTKQQNDLDSLATSYQENRQQITHSQTEVKVEIGKLEQVISSPSSPELKRLTEYVQQLNRDLADKQKAQSKLQESLSELREKRTNNQRQIERNKNTQERLKLHLEGLVVSIEDCKKSLRSVDSMLFFKLAKSSPQKANIASRALTLGLLKTPVKDELEINSVENSLLGFEIDTSHLPPQQVLDKDELESRLSELEQDEQRTQESLTALGEERTELDEQANALYQELNNAEIEFGQFKNGVEQTESRLKQTETDIKTETRKIKEQAKQVKREKQNLLDELDSKDKALLGDYESDKTKIKQIAKDGLSESFRQIKDKESSLHQYKKTQLLELSQKVEELEAKKRNDLTEQGAQTEAIDACEASISKQSAKLTSAKEAQIEYEKYSIWLDSEYIELDKWKGVLSERQGGLAKREREQELLTISFNKAVKEHNNTTKELNKTLQIVNHEILTLRQLLGGYLSDLIAKENSGVAPPADRLQRQVKSIISEIEEHDKNGKDLFRRVMASLRQYDELYKLCRDLLLQEGLDELDTGINWKVLAVSLSHLMGGTLVEQIDTIKQVFATKSKELVSLDEKLTETEKRILSKGREISRQFNNSGTSFENIHALEVDVKTSLSRLPFRKSLNKAAKAFNEAKILGAHESPTDTYFDVISTAVRDIAEQKSGLDISSFVEVVVKAKNSEYEPWREAVTNEELEGISSEGLSLLILISLYAAIKNVIQKNHSAVLLWSIDEIGKLHSDNTSELKAILEKERIQVFGATPEANLKVVEAFNHFYDLRTKDKIHKFTDTKRLLAKDALFGSAQQVSGEVHA